jgi:DNA/RNA-binding domain of Phe-tRNA-synthetase-like protein
LEAFKHYLNIAFKNNDKPNIVLAWGSEPYKYIKHCAIKSIEDKYCILKNDNGAIVHVLSIKHPMIANQNDTHAKIENLIVNVLKKL